MYLLNLRIQSLADNYSSNDIKPCFFTSCFKRNQRLPSTPTPNFKRVSRMSKKWVIALFGKMRLLIAWIIYWLEKLRTKSVIAFKCLNNSSFFLIVPITQVISAFQNTIPWFLVTKRFTRYKKLCKPSSSNARYGPLSTWKCITGNNK